MDTVRQHGDLLFGSLLLIQAERQLAELLVAVDQPQAAKKWRDESGKLAATVRQVFWDEEVGLFRAATLKCRAHDLWGGQLRHLPAGVYWEIACAKDTYQNGGFWATPVGWYIYTLEFVNPATAEQTFVDLVNNFQDRGVHEWVLGERPLWRTTWPAQRCR